MTTPLLFTHGFASSSHAWAPLVDALSPTRQCITWDVRGHGKGYCPDETAEYSIPLTLADMERLLDESGVARAVLVGHSMGGYLSLEFQKAHPDRVAGLVLIGTGPGFRKDEARAGWNNICDRYAHIFATKGFAGLGESAELDGRVHDGVEGLINAAHGILRQHDAGVIDNLAHIDVPTLIIVGSEDKPFVAGSDYMAAKIPGARKVVVDGAPHAPMLTHTDVVLAEMEKFLDAID